MSLAFKARVIGALALWMAASAASAEPVCVPDQNEALKRAVAYHSRVGLEGANAKLLEGAALKRAQWCEPGTDCTAYFRTNAQAYVEARTKSALILYARDPQTTCAFLFAKGAPVRYARKAVDAKVFDETIEAVRADVSGERGASPETKKRSLTTRKLSALRNGVCDVASLNAPDDGRGFTAVRSVQSASADEKSLAAALFPDSFRNSLNGIEHLSIIPFGPMTTLPLAALKPFGGESAAVDLFTINYLLFAGDVARAPVKWGGAPKAALILGNPRPTDNVRAQCVTDLPWAEEEAKFAHSLFPGTFLDRSQATSAAFATHAKTADLIYLAAHGLAGADDGIDDSFIALADKNLTARDVQHLSEFNFKTQLVVMSACQTGLGRVKEFGVIGLARTFLDAGAQNAVMTLWNVDDQSTSILMAEFSRGLATAPPAVALRNAQRTLRRDPRYAAPFYWAGFSVYGNEIVGPPAP